VELRELFAEESFGSVVESGAGFTFGFWPEGDRVAFVAGFAGGGIDGDLGEKGDVLFFSFSNAAASSKDVVAFSRVAFEVGHVFNEAEDVDVDFGEHGDGFAGVDEGDFLGGGDDDGAVEGDLLNNGELDVSSARREVEDEDIQFSPSDLVEELLSVAGGKGATNDNRGTVP